jgi:hypothetical protein
MHPNFFERYQIISESSENYGFRRDFGNLGREKNPWLLQRLGVISIFTILIYILYWKNASTLHDDDYLSHGSGQ